MSKYFLSSTCTIVRLVEYSKCPESVSFLNLIISSNCRLVFPGFIRCYPPIFCGPPPIYLFFCCFCVRSHGHLRSFGRIDASGGARETGRVRRCCDDRGRRECRSRKDDDRFNVEAPVAEAYLKSITAKSDSAESGEERKVGMVPVRIRSQNMDVSDGLRGSANGVPKLELLEKFCLTFLRDREGIPRAKRV